MGQRSADENAGRDGALLAELAKLDPDEERFLAEEWLAAETPWPSS